VGSRDILQHLALDDWRASLIELVDFLRGVHHSPHFQIGDNNAGAMGEVLLFCLDAHPAVSKRADGIAMAVI